MQSYFYAIWSLSFLIIWVALYIFLPKHRRSMFWTSWNFAPAGPVSEYWLYSDYWHPNYVIDIRIFNWHFGIEDYLLVFATAGISAAIFELIVSRENFAVIPEVSPKTYFKMKFWGFIGFVIMILMYLIGLNAFNANTLTVVIVTILIQYRHLKIFLLSFLSAIIFSFFYLLYFILFLLPIFPGLIEKYWNLENTFGIMWKGIPIEEFIWAFSACLFAGPIYRICSTKTLFRKF